MFDFIEESFPLLFALIFTVSVVYGIQYLKATNACSVIGKEVGVNTKYQGDKCWAEVQKGIWLPIG